MQAPTSSSGGGFGDSHELVCHRRLALFTTLFWVVIVAGLAAAAAASAARVGQVFVLVVWMMAAFDGDSEMMLLVVSLFCYRTSFYVAVMTNSVLPVGNASKLHDCCLLQCHQQMSKTSRFNVNFRTHNPATPASKA